MIRGTTPTFHLVLDSDVDLTDTSVYITFSEKNRGIQYTFESGDENVSITYSEGHTVIDVSMTQEQTLYIKEASKVNVQVRWVDSEGYAGATAYASIEVDPVLLDEVIVYRG